MSEILTLFGRERDNNPNLTIDYQGEDYEAFQESLKSTTYVLANPIFFVKTAEQLSKILTFSYVDTFGYSITKKFLPSKWSKSSNFNEKLVTLEGLQVIVNNKTKLELELIDDEITIVWQLYKLPSDKIISEKDLDYLFTEGNPLQNGLKHETATFTISKAGIPVNVSIAGSGQVQVKNTDTNAILGTFDTQGTHTIYAEQGSNISAFYSVDTTIDSPSDAKASKFFFQRVGDISLDGVTLTPNIHSSVLNATGNESVPTAYTHDITNIQTSISLAVIFEKSSEQNIFGHYKAKGGTSHLNDYVAYDTSAPSLVLDTNTVTTVQKIKDLTGKGNDLEQLQAGKSTQSSFDGVKIDFDGTNYQGYERKGSTVNYTNLKGIRLFNFLVFKVNQTNRRNAVFTDVAAYEGGNNGGNVCFADKRKIKVGFDAPSYGGGAIRNVVSNAVSLVSLLPDSTKFESHIVGADGYTNSNSGRMSSYLSKRFGYFNPVVGNVANNYRRRRGLQPVKGEFYEQLIISNLHTVEEVEAITDALKTAYSI